MNKKYKYRDAHIADKMLLAAKFSTNLGTKKGKICSKCKKRKVKRHHYLCDKCANKRDNKFKHKLKEAEQNGDF